jgi:hypothetical protein
VNGGCCAFATLGSTPATPGFLVDRRGLRGAVPALPICYKTTAGPRAPKLPPRPLPRPIPTNWTHRTSCETAQHGLVNVPRLQLWSALPTNVHHRDREDLLALDTITAAIDAAAYTSAMPYQRPRIPLRPITPAHPSRRPLCRLQPMPYAPERRLHLSSRGRLAQTLFLIIHTPLSFRPPQAASSKPACTMQCATARGYCQPCPTNGGRRRPVPRLRAQVNNKLERVVLGR